MITTDDALASLCEAVRAFPAIALDTEFVRTRTYYPQLGLIQLFDGEHLALIDPLGITDWSPLKAILRDPSITKFLHAGSEDLEVFLNVFGELPQPLIDTQTCCLLRTPDVMGFRFHGGRVFRRYAGQE